MRQQASEWIEGYRSGDRAVSPVIGVILMVAITVILAAVIAAFVLGGVGTGEKVPSAQMTMSQSDGVERTTHTSGGNFQLKCNNLVDTPKTIPHQISASHDGGDAIIERNLQVYVSTGNGTSGSSADDHQAARGIGFKGVTGTSGSCNGMNFEITQPLWNARTDEKVQANAEIKVAHWMVEDQDFTTGPGVNNGLFGARENWNAGGFTNTNELIFGRSVCFANWPKDSDLGIHSLEDGSGGDGGPDNQKYLKNCGEDATWSSNTADSESIDMADDVQGWLYTGDEVRVVWSPPDSDKSQELASKEVQ
jgi:flagellin-like protein